MAPTARAVTPRVSSAIPPRSASVAPASEESRSLRPRRRPRSAGAARSASCAVAATNETFQPSPSEKQKRRAENAREPGQADAREPHQHEPAVQRLAPADAVDRRPDEEDQRVHAEDVRADDREDVLLGVVVVLDDDVAREIHHRDHHGEACEGDEHRDDAGPAEDLAQRRGCGGRLARLRRPDRLGDLLRVGPDEDDDRERDQRDPAGGEPRHGQRVGFELLAREERREEAVRGSRRRRHRRGERRCPRAPLGGYMSPAAVRASSATPPEAPVKIIPAITSAVESVRVARAITEQPIAAIRNPAASTGTRPKRSMRPAGSAGARRREEDRRTEPEQAGDARDRDERASSRPPRAGRDTSSPRAPRRAGSCSGGRSRSIEQASRNSALPPWAGCRTYGAPSSRCARRPTASTLCHLACRGERVDERPGILDLVARGLSIRGRVVPTVRVRGHEVPQEHIAGDAKLRERSVDDRRADLRRARAGELALRREREARDARARRTRRLPTSRSCAHPATQVLRAGAAAAQIRVLVVGCADVRQTQVP